MCLIARLLAEMVVSFYRRLKSDDPSREFGSELVEVIDPVSSKRGSVADELAPYRAPQPVIDCYIPNRIDRNHTVSFYNEEKNKKIRKDGDASGSLSHASANSLWRSNFKLEHRLPYEMTR
jgi:hypothetical protein